MFQLLHLARKITKNEVWIDTQKSNCQINSANSSLVAQLKISEASEKIWSARESERLSTFGKNIKVFKRGNSQSK